MRAKRWLLFSTIFLCSFFHVAGLLVPVLCGSQPLLVLNIVLLFSVTLASGYVCFWPVVSGAYVGCAVCAVSAALSSWVSFCCDCLGAGCLVAVFCTILLLLFVELPWGLFCGILSPWPLVAPYPSVISRIRRNLSIHIARFSASESLRAYTNIYKNSPPFANSKGVPNRGSPVSVTAHVPVSHMVILSLLALRPDVSIIAHALCNLFLFFFFIFIN